MTEFRVSDAEAAAFLEEEREEAAGRWWAPAGRRIATRAAAVLAACAAATALAGAVVALAAGASAVGTAPATTPRGEFVQLEALDVPADPASDDPTAEKPVFKHCLCVFDIDRTLTGKQGWKDKCPNDAEHDGVEDQAYARGTMLASELAQSMHATFCGQCYHGIVTAGVASGPNSAERQRLMQYIGGTARTRTDFWQDIQFKPETPVVSSLVVQASDGRKQDSVKSMVQWWREKQNIPLKDEDVYFFDDIKENVLPFKGTGFNARQVSCAVRGPSEMPGAYDGKIGGCGGEVAELEKFEGVHVCGED